MMVDDDPLDLPACLDRRREREAEEINARTGFNEEEEARIREERGPAGDAVQQCTNPEAPLYRASDDMHLATACRMYEVAR